ncbi:MAG: D-2-hydroxyacid dehydrogenase [Formosimonas sp.]
MFGLILSKSAAQYAQLTRESGIAADSFQVAHTLKQVDDSALPRTTWLLADPSLAVPLLPRLPNLRWLQSTWAGVESLLAAPNVQNYTLTNIKDVFAPLMTEYILAHCLAHERQVLAHHAAQKAQQWHSPPCGVIRGKTLLIVGAGSIGAAMATTLSGLGLTILAVVNTPRPLPHVAQVGCLRDLPQLLPQADYVVNILPNTPVTQNIVNAEFLAHMKPSALFINVGRGQAVVEADLAAALHHGTIAGAVLDVYRQEPLPPEHEFWRTPRLTLTSHTAAPSLSADIFAVFIDNYQRLCAGQALRHVVDFARGY